MSISVEHNFQSPYQDSGDPNRVQPSHWNDAHAVALSGALKAIDGLVPSANKIAVFSGADAAALVTISAAIQAWLASATLPDAAAALGAATLASPAFTGTPTAPTAAPGTNTTQIATTAFATAAIAAAIASLIGSAPATLDTLQEIADALNDNPAQIADILTALGNRVRFDAAQTLDAGQKTQARTNIGLGTAATKNTGTAVGDVVEVQAGGKLPALDASDLTGLPGGFSGAYADLTGKPTLGTAAALDVGTTGNKVLQLNASAQIPAVSGALLTNLPTPSGVVTDVRLGTVANMGTPYVDGYTPNDAAAGNVLVGTTLNGNRTVGTYMRVKPLQKYVNGAWYTVSG